MSSRFSGNSKAFASELPENLEEKLRNSHSIKDQYPTLKKVYVNMFDWTLHEFYILYSFQDAKSPSSLPTNDGVTMQIRENKSRTKYGTLTRHDSLQTNNSSKIVDLKVQPSKFTPLPIFKPKNMTFNFLGRRFKPRDTKYLSWSAECDVNKPITHSSKLEFLDFVELFQSFSLWCRKDLKDIFDQIATTTPKVQKKISPKYNEKKIERKQCGEKKYES